MSKKKAIGIDLGTSKCCVGVVRDGAVEILENERGNKTTPSYVAFTDTERLVGEDAKDQATLNPANTVMGVKRFMCPELNKSARKNSINAIINEQGGTRFQVTYKTKKQTLLPQQLSAMLLTKLKSLAEEHLKSSVEEAVISVPASFSNAQRQATKDAATIAGLKVLALIDEPTAAAIAYQTNRKKEGKETIVIVDFGAGKLDVSVVTVDDGYICVNGVSGSTDIGGTDVDEMLMSHIITKYKEEFNNNDPPLDGGAMERLRSICENIKTKCSLLPKVQETIDCFGEAHIFRITLNRDEFNKMLPTKFFGYLEGCLQDSLNVARVGQKDISRVLIVGGSTRLLVIQEWLQKLFKCPIDRSVNPDEAVAAGAAVQAALLSRDHEVKELVVQGAIGTTFHLLLEDGKHTMNIFGREYLAAAPSEVYSLKTAGLVKKHTYHVYEKFIGRKQSYYPNGSFVYSSGLCCRVDKCGIFHVGAPGGQNRDGSVELTDILNNVPGKLSEEILQKFKAEEIMFQKDGQNETCRTEAMSKLESLCFRYLSDLQKVQVTESFPESVHRFAEHVKENLDWLNAAASVSADECHEKKNLLELEYITVRKEIRRHKEQLETERVAAATEFLKCCLGSPFFLTEADKMLKESGLLDTQKGLLELIVEWAAPNCTLTADNCVKCIEALQQKNEEPHNGERENGTKTCANTTRHEQTSNGVRAGSVVDKSYSPHSSFVSQSAQTQEASVFDNQLLQDNSNSNSRELQEVKSRELQEVESRELQEVK